MKPKHLYKTCHACRLCDCNVCANASRLEGQIAWNCRAIGAPRKVTPNDSAPSSPNCCMLRCSVLGLCWFYAGCCGLLCCAAPLCWCCAGAVLVLVLCCDVPIWIDRVCTKEMCRRRLPGSRRRSAPPETPQPRSERFNVTTLTVQHHSTHRQINVYV